eukprot:SAG22_NODE_2129_length_2969_cov_6.022997_1_plen_679_part_10
MPAVPRPQHLQLKADVAISSEFGAQLSSSEQGWKLLAEAEHLDFHIDSSIQRRQLQGAGSTTLSVSYSIVCPGGDCDSLTAQLDGLRSSPAGLAHAEALIAAISEVGSTFGVEGAVTSSAADLAASFTAPELVTIAIPGPAGCPDFDAAAQAESDCKTGNRCTECSDFNFGDDCDSNTNEHCAEIDCCPACGSEIQAMWTCEHGQVCGNELSCPSDECPDFDAAAQAESDCKTGNGCTECSDFNFGDNCDSNKDEHCAEIDCCPACEAEIQAMWTCEHGPVCGNELACGQSGFEWIGAFALADTTHTWSMQAVDGVYADASMRLVLIPTDAPTADTIESLEDQGASLITGDSCTVVEDGESMGAPEAAGSCFELHAGEGIDSLYTIDTTGLSGFVVFAQHSPLEFERDRHYLFDSSDADVEPTAQESVGGDHDHGHDHDHDHDHAGESCACAAGEADHPFTIDCSNTAGFAAAEALLNGADCEATEDSCSQVDSNDEMPCQIAFFMLQAHHDMCDHDVLTTEQEHLVHDFEAACLNCVASRAFDPAIRNCIQPTCDDSAPALAATAVLNAGCTAESCCTSVEQQQAFALLWEYHELCDHDQVPETAETAIHAFEDTCESYAECNIPATMEPGYDPMVCPPPPSFEWVGAFALADTTHTWSMQAVDGVYADASMRLVLIP